MLCNSYIINNYSGSKSINFNRAYKLPQTVLFWSDPFLANWSILSVQEFAIQLRDETGTFNFHVYLGACCSFHPSVLHDLHCW